MTSSLVTGGILERTTRFGRVVWQTLLSTRAVLKLNPKNGKPIARELRHPIMTDWAQKMLAAIRVYPHRTGAPVSEKPVMFVGNHVSYIDIPLLMSVTPVVFVAKMQIKGWPIFGAATTCVGTIFVERESSKSRALAGLAIAPMVQDQQSVAVFPSGTTTMDEGKPWRHGPFRIAMDQGISVQPFRIRYKPMRLAAYLMEDSFVGHLWKLLGNNGVEATVEFAEPFTVTDPLEDARRVWEWSREGL